MYAMNVRYVCMNVCIICMCLILTKTILIRVLHFSYTKCEHICGNFAIFPIFEVLGKILNRLRIIIHAIGQILIALNGQILNE